jgi:hypothetical protein
MKKKVWIWMGLVGVILLSGCATQQTPPLITRKGGNDKKPMPKNIAFRVVDTSSKKNDATADVVLKTEGRLIENRFVSLRAGELDMAVLIPCRIQIATDLEAFDHLGENYVFKARANVTVTAKDEHHTLDWGKRQFSVKGDRVLGEDAARRNATDHLAEEVSAWVVSGCSAKRDAFTKFRASSAFQDME